MNVCKYPFVTEEKRLGLLGVDILSILFGKDPSGLPFTYKYFRIDTFDMSKNCTLQVSLGVGYHPATNSFFVSPVFFRKGSGWGGVDGCVSGGNGRDTRRDTYKILGTSDDQSSFK